MQPGQPEVNAGDTHPIETRVPGGSPIPLVAHYAEFAAYYPDCELQTKRWMVEHVRPDWVCLDVGANIGYHSVLLGRLAASGRVYAFEPTETYDMLLANLAHNAATNVTPVKLAVGARSFTGTEPLYRIWGREPEPTTAEFTTVDDIVRRLGLARVDLVKIDVDGFDLEVLWGARETLARFAPAVIVELSAALETRGHRPSEAMRWMLAQGYDRALVLDLENVVFTKSGASTSGADGPAPDSLRLSFDDRDPLAEWRPVLADETEDVPFEIRVHNSATTDADGSVRIDEGAWAYAASVHIREDELSGDSDGFALSFDVHEGHLGVFLADAQTLAPLADEVRLPGDGCHDVTFERAGRADGAVVLRQTTNVPLRVSVRAARQGRIRR